MMKNFLQLVCLLNGSGTGIHTKDIFWKNGWVFDKIFNDNNCLLFYLLFIPLMYESLYLGEQNSEQLNTSSQLVFFTTHGLRGRQQHVRGEGAWEESNLGILKALAKSPHFHAF